MIALFLIWPGRSLRSGDSWLVFHTIRTTTLKYVQHVKLITTEGTPRPFASPLVIDGGGTLRIGDSWLVFHTIRATAPEQRKINCTKTGAPRPLIFPLSFNYWRRLDEFVTYASYKLFHSSGRHKAPKGDLIPYITDYYSSIYSVRSFQLYYSLDNHHSYPEHHTSLHVQSSKKKKKKDRAPAGR